MHVSKRINGYGAVYFDDKKVLVQMADVIEQGEEGEPCIVGLFQG
jgi:hypothetical protein